MYMVVMFVVWSILKRALSLPSSKEDALAGSVKSPKETAETADNKSSPRINLII